jgi:VWFA-related protein
MMALRMQSMRLFMSRKSFHALIFFALMLLVASGVSAQPENRRQPRGVRPVTVPISIFSKEELKDKQTEEILQVGNLIVREDDEQQTILSIRSIEEAPLQLAILIQEDLSSNVNLELNGLRNFIRRLPENSRVMVAYLRGGSIQTRQRFTTDLEKAANSLRIVTGNAFSAPASPYEGVSEALSRFDALPTGRRAILLVSDGLDTSRGIDSSSPTQSLDLDQAILKAQRRSVAVYSFYSPAGSTGGGNSILSLNGQGSLQRLADETGGRAFFQGSGAPVSFEPFFKDLTLSFKRQFALTYLSTHMNKGYHKLRINSTNPQIKIEHPRGYYYR